MKNKAPSRVHKEREAAMKAIETVGKEKQGFYVELPFEYYKKLRVKLIENDNQSMTDWLKEQIDNM